MNKFFRVVSYLLTFIFGGITTVGVIAGLSGLNEYVKIRHHLPGFD